MNGGIPLRPILRFLEPLPEEGGYCRFIIEDLAPSEIEMLEKEGARLSPSGESKVIVSGTIDELKGLAERLSSLPKLKDRLYFTLSLLKDRILRWRGGGIELSPGERTMIMGILNVTPDSFYDGGRFFDEGRAVDRALEMEEEGADIIDVGGESTRPGARAVSVDEEIRRVIPVVEALAKRLKVPISVDTRKAEVARLALEGGARIINDISGFGFDHEMVKVAARYRPLVILMHMRGTPETMQQDTTYKDLFSEIYRHLVERIEYALHEGVEWESIAIDPGIGFGKSYEDNLRIIKGLGEFRSIGRPVVVGPSRKSFIGHLLGLGPEDRLEGTAAATAVSILKGAHIVRVHDVRAIKRVATVVDGIRGAQR